MTGHIQILEDTIKDLESVLFDPTVESALTHYSKINTRSLAPKEVIRKLKILKAAARVRPRRTE